MRPGQLYPRAESKRHEQLRGENTKEHIERSDGGVVGSEGRQEGLERSHGGRRLKKRVWNHNPSLHLVVVHIYLYGKPISNFLFPVTFQVRMGGCGVYWQWSRASHYRSKEFEIT